MGFNDKHVGLRHMIALNMERNAFRVADCGLGDGNSGFWVERSTKKLARLLYVRRDSYLYLDVHTARAIGLEKMLIKDTVIAGECSSTSRRNLLKSDFSN